MQDVPQFQPALPLTPRGIPYTPTPKSFFLPLNVSSRFGAKLRQLRLNRNMTQLGMAVEFGIDRTFISDVERGRKSISLPMLEIVALGFHLTLSELLRDV